MRKPSTTTASGTAASEAAPSSTGALPKGTRSNNEGGGGGGLGAAAAGGKTVFEQMVARMPSLGPEALLLPHRVWKVKFVGKRGHKRFRSTLRSFRSKQNCD